MHRLRRSIGVLALATVLAGCATSTSPGAVGVTRPQLLLVPRATINAQAAEGYTKLSSAAGQVGKLNNDPILTSRVKEVANKLIGQVGAYRPDAVSWQWEVSVFDSDKINAFCFPGGKIGVFTGMIRRLDLTNDELAAVLGHEMAHALREHSREKVSQNQLSNAIVQAIANSSSRYASLSSATAALGSQLLVQLPNSREMELEADLMGLELMARAGYNPRLASNVWRKMMQVSGGQSGVEFFNTHPNDDRRMAALDASVPKVLALYEGATGVNVTVPVVAVAVSATSPALQAPPARIMAASTSPKSAGKAVVPLGQDSYQIERIARQQACHAEPLARLTEKGPGFETYTVACSNGAATTYRCEFGNCRVLQ